MNLASKIMLIMLHVLPIEPQSKPGGDEERTHQRRVRDKVSAGPGATDRVRNAGSGPAFK
jgi:hypothetical protein